MKFYFSNKLNLRPKQYSVPLERGTFGHTLFEAAFTVIMNGGAIEEAMEACNELVSLELQNNPKGAMDNVSIYKHVMAFVQYVIDQPWKIVALEEFETFEIEPGIEFGYTPDLKIEWTEGIKRGSLSILDYKFTGKYWNDRQLATVQQMPKYMLYHNKTHEQKVRHCGVVMLNTRAGSNDTGTKLFLVKWLNINKEKLARIEHENSMLVRQLEPYLRMTPQEYLDTVAVRTVDEYECMSCPFADDLCPMMMEGRDIKHAIAANYEENDYGYN